MPRRGRINPWKESTWRLLATAARHDGFVGGETPLTALSSLRAAKVAHASRLDLRGGEDWTLAGAFGPASPHAMAPLQKRGGRRFVAIHNRHEARSIVPRAQGGHETQGSPSHLYGLTTCTGCARGCPADRSLRNEDATSREHRRPRARGNPASQGEGQRPKTACAAVSCPAAYRGFSAARGDTREEMPKFASSSIPSQSRTRMQGGNPVIGELDSHRSGHDTQVECLWNKR